MSTNKLIGRMVIIVRAYDVEKKKPRLFNVHQILASQPVTRYAS